MPAYNFNGYRSASSRYTGLAFNGIKVEVVLAKRHRPGERIEYLAICRPADKHGQARVLDYNHVVQAASGQINLKHKYDISVSPARHGLVSADEPIPATVSAVPASKTQPSASRTLIGGIQRDSASGSVDLDRLDFAGALFVMNKLVVAAKQDDNIADLVKLIAATL